MVSKLKTPVSATIYLSLSIYPTSPKEQDTTQGHSFKQSLTGLNSEFFSLRLVAISRPKSLVCPLFTHNWGENSWIHTFPKGISTMWNANSSSRIWTRVAMSPSYNDNHYATNTSSLSLWLIASLLNIDQKNPFDMLNNLSGWHNRMYTCFLK